MKSFPIWLVLAAVFTAPVAFAEENIADSAIATESNASAVQDLCKTYAQEDGIQASQLDAYIKECMASMTDLSEAMQESLPLTAGESGEPTAAPTSEALSQDPEQLVKSELVETPDPAAEQLDAGKN